jgi:hypothetical protein
LLCLWFIGYLGRHQCESAESFTSLQVAGFEGGS